MRDFQQHKCVSFMEILLILREIETILVEQICNLNNEALLLANDDVEFFVELDKKR